MAEDYFKSLREELNGFSPVEQEALLEEIRSHLDAGEQDPRMGRNGDERMARIMNELGSPKDLARQFKDIYRPGRILDYLLILIPVLLQPYLDIFYINVVMPRYAGGALLLDAVLHLLLALVGLWRRSAAVTLFWAAIAIGQLSIVTGRLYSYYGIQTVFWAILLIGLLYLSGNVLWRHRNEPILVAFGLITVGMSVIGSLVSTLAMIRPFALSIWRGASLLAQYGANGLLDRSLLQAYIQVHGTSEFYAILVLALFFIPSSRKLRWGALGLAGLLLGLGHQFLLDAYDKNLMAPWIYFAWIIIPTAIAMIGWWLEPSGQPVMDAIAA